MAKKELFPAPSIISSFFSKGDSLMLCKEWSIDHRLMKKSVIENAFGGNENYLKPKSEKYRLPRMGKCPYSSIWDLLSKAFFDNGEKFGYTLRSNGGKKRGANLSILPPATRRISNVTQER